MADTKRTTESRSDIRKRAWKTRREKFGDKGHAGYYSTYSGGRLDREKFLSMQGALIRLWREGVLSEGQVSKAIGLDRVSCRQLASEQADEEATHKALISAGQ